MKYFILLLLVGLSYGQWNSSGHIKGTQDAVFSQDAATNSITTVDYEHHELHDGNHFFVNGFTTKNSGDSIYFSVTTPNTTKWLHMTFLVSSTGALKGYVYEGATVTGGTAVTPWNNNRNSSNTSSATVKASPAISAAGTAIDSSYAGSGQRVGGASSRSTEIILKQNSTYLFIFISAAATNVINYSGEWYEHTNK